MGKIFSKGIFTLYLSMLILITGGWISASQPNFNNNVFILNAPDPREIFNVDEYPIPLIDFVGRFPDLELSLHGDFVVGRTQIVDEGGNIPFSSLYLWNINQHMIDDDIVYLEPFVSRVLSEEEARADFVISPHEQYLALRGETTLHLLNLLNLQTLETTPVFGEALSGITDWSENNQLIGTILGRGAEIAAWDFENNIINTRSLNVTSLSEILLAQQPHLVALSNGWFLAPFYNDPALLFVFCDYVSLTCTHYRADNSIRAEWSRTISTSDGSKVLSVIHSTEGTADTQTIYMWEYQNNGVYFLERVTPLDEEICSLSSPQSFNTSGEYIYSLCAGYKGVIWDMETLTPLFRFDNPHRLTWLTNEKYFIVFDNNFTISLYSVDEQDPIDSINLLSLEDINPDDLVFNDFSDIAGISVDDHTLLINVGNLGFVIFINFA